MINNTSAYIIGETAFYHQGDINYLKELIKAASDLKLDSIKFHLLFDIHDYFVKRKVSIVKRYIDFFNKYNFIQTPKIDLNVSNSYWLFTFLVLDNAPFSSVDLIDFLDKNSIEARPVFYPLGDMPPYKSYKTKSLDNSIFVSKRGISLSTSPALLDKEINYICNTLESFFKLK
jgi:perosamine synthetase